MRYNGLDLNLLVILEKLFSDRSVSQAARELNMTQPAVSNALARLRRHFGDALFVQAGRRLTPTPFAESLRHSVDGAFAELQTIATTRAAFDPAVAERTFTIVTSDQAYLTLVTAAVRRLSREAASLRVRALLTSETRGEMLRRGMVDFIINPNISLVEEHPSEVLFEDRLVCVAWTGSTRVVDPMSLDDFCALGHVETSLNAQPARIDRVLEALGRTRRIAAFAPSFVMIADTVVGTDYIGMIGARPAAVFAERLPIRLIAPPLDLPPLRLMLQWHRSREGDPGIVWMRAFLRRVAAEEGLPPIDDVNSRIPN